MYSASGLKIHVSDFTCGIPHVFMWDICIYVQFWEGVYLVIESVVD